MSRVALDVAALGVLLPMHTLLAPDGRVLSVGPTLAKAAASAGVRLEGAPFLERAHLREPTGIADLAGLRASAGRPLRLTLGDGETRLRGVAVAAEGGAVLVNLSFGIDAVAAVGRHGLTIDDFAPTDAAPELLYLAEARAAAHRELVEMTDRLEAARREAETLARSDELTGLCNRRALDQRLARLHAAGGAYAILGIDLDRFKAVNDAEGHAAGDEVLRAAADALRGSARRDDVVARVGGDEFVLVLDGDLPRSRLLRIAEETIARIERPVPLGGGRFAAISASAGIVRRADLPGAGPEDLLRAGDAALYAAKRAGRGQARFHDELSTRCGRRDD